MHPQLAHNFLRVVNWSPSNPEIGPSLIITAILHTPVTARAWPVFLDHLNHSFETQRTANESHTRPLANILSASVAAYLSARAYDTGYSTARFVDQFLTSYANTPWQRSEYLGRHPFRLTRLIRLSQRYRNVTIDNDLAFRVAGDVIRQELLTIDEAFNATVMSLKEPVEEIDSTIRDLRSSVESLGGMDSVMRV